MNPQNVIAPSSSSAELPAKTGFSWGGETPFLLVGGAMLLGFAPLWAAYLGNLWSREAYQFFPLALAGVGLLLYREKEEFPRPLRRGSGWVAGALWLVSLLLLAVGTWLWSPWLGAIALLPALAGLVWWLGGWPLFSALFPAGMLLLTIIIPPLKLDEVFTLKLQNLSTVGSSWVLHALHVKHTMYGNVIEIPGHKLLVEEACSGMKSVLFTGAACIFYMFWRRRSLLIVLFSMALLLGVVILGNLVRITSGVWLEYFYKINILTGTRHEIVGMIMLACYLGFILTLNVLYEKLGVPVTGKKSPVLSTTPNAASARNFSLPWWLRSGLAAFAMLGLAQIGLAWRGHVTDTNMAHTASSVLEKDAAIEIPSLIDGWYRVRSGPPSMHKVEALGGITSQIWQFRKGSLVGTVSLDYPFMGYHDVQICYVGNGCQPYGSEAFTYEGAGGISPYLQVPMKKDGREVTLWYSTIDEKGNWMENSFAKKNILERFRHEVGETTTTYRIQMVINGAQALTPEELQKARSFYEHIREEIVPYLLPKKIVAK